jgi:hypothetical protein
MVMRNKRAWIRILEATMAVLIVSGVLLVVYARQSDRSVSPADYFYSLQRQVLADISSRSDLRLAVLNVNEDVETDDNFVIVNDFVNSRVPEAFGYSLRICDLGSNADFCKMRSDVYISTVDRDVFVEEIVISSEIGGGEDAVGDDPKKVRFFIWENR